MTGHGRSGETDHLSVDALLDRRRRPARGPDVYRYASRQRPHRRNQEPRQGQRQRPGV